MKLPEKILVPLDLSPRSRAGVEYAAALAEACGASLLLVTNVNMPELAVVEAYAEANDLAVDDAGEAQLRALADELAPGLHTEIRFAFDDFPADGILTVAEAEGVDLIVVASHGRSGMTRWLLGSVAEKVARASEVPVVIVPARDLRAGPYDR